MKKVRIGINGLGRIGRSFLRLAEEREEVEVVAVNDLGDIDNLAYLLRYDTVYGKNKNSVRAEKGDKNHLLIGNKKILFLSEKDPSRLPWRMLDVDVVVESTGVFESFEKSKIHLEAGSRRVVISAPVKDEPPEGIAGATVLLGINDEKLNSSVITSNASCTTNSASPLIQILHEGIGIEKAVLNTVHAYTATQALVDAPAKGDFRRGRAAAQNIVPSTTGAAIAVTKAVPDLENKFDGIAMRVPVVAGSVADVTFIAKRDTTVEEVNGLLRAAALQARWKGIFTVSEEPLVSTDIVGNTHAAIADISFTKVVGGNLVKVLSWYDNEAGYTHALLEHVIKLGKFI